MANFLLDDTNIKEVSFCNCDSEYISYDHVIALAFCLKDSIGKCSESQLRIAICIDRSAEYLACVVAAWKIGACVIPLNRSWPREKIDSILQSIGPSLVVVDDSTDMTVQNYPTYKIGSNWKNELEYRDFDETELNGLNASDWAYIIFTSGSTGVPKGVTISCEAYRTYVDWTSTYFQAYRHHKKLLVTAELTFDITMGDLAFAMSFGTTVFVNRLNRNIPAILGQIMTYKIDVLYSVPSTHLALVDFASVKRGSDLSSLRLILSGGERFPWSLVSEYARMSPEAHFYNVYGPTEFTINCFVCRLDNLLDSDKQGPIPIGKCFDHLEYILLNDDAIADEVGELCVAGSQSMVGYFNDDRLTESSFFFVGSGEEKKKFYRTGDIAYLENELVFLKGRRDGLVKIRGYRVHPDEISQSIDSISWVEASAVVLSSEGRLVAFFVTRKSGSLSSIEREIRGELVQKIPEYMMPHEFQKIERFPLNVSGKIDKVKLKELL